jgi:hypothetical protein
MLTAVQSDLASLTSSIGSASSIVSGATGTVTCTVANSGDVTMLLGNLGMAQTLVASLQTTLTTAVSSLSASKLRVPDFPLLHLDKA